MKLFCDFEIALDGTAREAYEGLFHEACRETLAYEGFPYEAEIELSLVSRTSIRELNAEARNIDAETDVLSFPMIDFSPEDNGRRYELEAKAYLTDPETGCLNLGIIVIAWEVARDQAQAYGHSLERELAFLAVHSTLHLLGYDHETPEQEREMFGRQEEILTKMGLTRG